MSTSLTSASLPSLIRSYLVYTACSLPFLIDHAPALLHAFTHSPIPGVGALAEWAVRHTFFAQFVPGESVAECLGTMWALRGRNVGTLLNYSAEADESGESAKVDMRAMERQRLEEVYRAIEAMGEFEREAERRGASAFALKIVSRAGAR
jgi:proline dehydrogenase